MFITRNNETFMDEISIYRKVNSVTFDRFYYDTYKYGIITRPISLNFVHVLYDLIESIDIFKKKTNIYLYELLNNVICCDFVFICLKLKQIGYLFVYLFVSVYIVLSMLILSYIFYNIFHRISIFAFFARKIY